ncbi:uncharacterized protein YbcC (UPF0753/DUF2309 family) [Flavobacterium sp. CG_9.10]|uniref:DUF2309 domain-containing protein n=1 Tax=Flavobacterium sp. CG_9.10 TaxID=2787729 RepID=UPI0018C91EFB|nr:DUF2309 domain-containing protein [Flavobacterium sp. CG_9.10]MBG6109313.1 uncharacterized protein YbcC (UPF0753/DUF2309 family) [Flavobacterium sp. CG_9.10]
MINLSIQNSIEEAAQVIGKTWPLYSFVASNPLSGQEKMPFEKAVKQAQKALNANVFPESALFRQAWEKGEIDKNVLLELLEENQLSESPDHYLQKMASQKTIDAKNSHHDLDRIMAKWLAAFMDEGLAEWNMPNKNEGFYGAWRKLAVYDSEMPKMTIAEIPKTSVEALTDVLNGYATVDFTKILTFHLAALPGWTGYINHRNTYDSQWQQQYPITLQDYLAVRLWVAKKIGAEIFPENNDSATSSSASKLQYIFLKAWEKSWQNELVKLLDNQQIVKQKFEKEAEVPDAQMVFCIDTRSELIRRHVENKGQYETFGYAGFFGIAMDYEDLKDGLTRKSCPPILNSAYHVSEIPQRNQSKEVRAYKRKNDVLNFKEYFLKRMKNMLPSAFGYVEGSGFFYGMSLIARTLTPAYLYRFNKKNTMDYESICEPQIKNTCTFESIDLDISLAEKVAIVKGAFDLMGWKKFAPLVLFIGHGSHSANNPFGSSLDCGACAASPGRHNARMLAKIANIPEVKQALRENHNIDIPASTIFIGGEHNTTTDAILLFDAEVPDSHKNQLQKLKLNLIKTQQTATQERLGIANNSVAFAQKKASNWGETRPEWGLAKNAGFIIGPRELTKNNNLDGRCFLHSYNWETDTNGKALEGVMQGPMVVTQWINNHYYFSTVDNEVFGGGSKITHNVTGKFGVVKGNGGDLKMGLPLQSVMESDLEMYHQPLRLSVVIQAPLSRVSEILLRNEHLKNLLDNEWIYLMVMDTLDENVIKLYQKDLNWIPADKNGKWSKDLKKNRIEVAVENLV